MTNIGHDTILTGLIERAKAMKEDNKSTEEIAQELGISENHVRNLLYPFPEPGINWGYNCLTAGVHHGRPEAVWNLPLLYAASTVFHRPDLKTLVIARIYNDARQVVAHNDKFDEDWADRVFEAAKENYDRVTEAKIAELTKYYESDSFRHDMSDAVERVMVDKLNPHFRPLHGHDSINMLCRILGVPASIKASS